MLRIRMDVGCLALLLSLAAPAAGQLYGQAAEAAEQARVRASAGASGLPALPPLRENSPRHLMIYEDRRIVHQDPTPTAADGSGPVLVSHTIPSGPGGTGTPVGELFWYQIPTDYVGVGDPRPLVIAYHGYGLTAASVASQTTINEECETRGWIYMAPTGLDDKVFGSLAGQHHIELAIQWMRDNFLVDADRIYMVGFSMGGNVIANFAARHRDPAGPMIAAVASVSGGFDLTLTYYFNTPAGKAIMEDPLNFGGSTAAVPFNYQQCSSLYANPGSYPPSPGTNNPVVSMGDNLHATPLYLTWDTGDPLNEKPQLGGPQLKTLVQNAGGTVQSVEVSGTVDPITQLPAPHSWAVLNEVDVFDFFAEHTLDGTPDVVVAQCDRSEIVSWMTLLQRTSGAFSWANADTSGPTTLSVTAVSNASQVTVDLVAAGKSGVWPLHVVAGSADVSGSKLVLTGFDQTPSYALQTSDGSVFDGDDVDPFTGSLTITLPPQGQIDVEVHSVPWLAKVWTSPDPVPLGGSVTLNLDAPADNAPTLAFLIVSLDRQLTNIKGGNQITASLPAGILLPPMGLDANADLTLSGSIGTDPTLSGLRLAFQGVIASGSATIDSITNLWTLDIQ